MWLLFSKHKYQHNFLGFFSSDVGIRIVVKNCTTDKAKIISKHMVEIFDDVIHRKYDDFEELSNEMRHKMREAVMETVLIFLSNGRQIVQPEEKCVVLHVRCVSLVTLLLLFRDYINGVLDNNMRLLEEAVRRCDGYENASLEVCIFKDEFWDILTIIGNFFSSILFLVFNYNKI